MIALEKSGPPAWIQQNGVEKTREYMAAPKGKKPTPWGYSAVVDALRSECRSKCMYCESKMTHCSYSEVEHIRPKSKFEQSVLEWTNLGLSCARCNRSKSDYWPDNPDLRVLNPYEDPIDDHLEFRGPLVVSRLDSKRGENTIRKLKFDERDDLVIAKMRRIQELHRILLIWRNEPDPELKTLYAEDVDSHLSVDQEFCGTLRAYAASFGFAYSGAISGGR